MEHQKFEQSLGQFEQFTEEYTTYTTPQRLLSITNNPRHVHNCHEEDKPKLKIINQKPQRSYIYRFLNHTKKQKKNVQINTQVIALGRIVFKGDFQSGNIDKVQKIAPTTYEITLRKQLNSNRVSTWFYFSVEGLRGQAKIIIKGFTKSCSLFNEGMKICYKESHQGKWRRGGSKIRYIRSQTQNDSQKQTYELQFYFFFKSNCSKVEFAYSFPYTYSHLIKFLACQQNSMRIQCLGKSYQGRDIPLITIGNPYSKFIIMMSARTHPGETVGSWMMEGFLKQLISDNEYSKFLRSTFLFKIIPMINPDGVVCGNYRFSASGFDLNRKWKVCNQRMHPQISLFKELTKQLSKSKQILMFIDLHGHSRLKNVFFYGCSKVNENGESSSRPKQFPFLMSKIHPPFRYDYCSYTIKKQKEGTARIYLWNQLKIDFIYTLEASFCGPEGISNFLIHDYDQIGRKLVQGISLHFFGIATQLSALSPNHNVLNDKKIQEQLKAKMTQFMENPEIRKIEHNGGNSSDSEPQAGQISEAERRDQKRAISIQKYYRATRVMKFSQKHNEQDNQMKTNLLNHPQKFKDKVKAGLMLDLKSNQITSKVLLTANIKNLSASISPPSQNQLYMAEQCMNKTTNKSFKLDMIHRQTYQKYPPQITFPQQQNPQIDAFNRIAHDKYKKPHLFGFQSAQYRRVRKFAQQNIRKHFSIQNNKTIKDQDNYDDDDETMMEYGNGSNIFEIERIGIKQLKGTFSSFPSKAIYGSTKKQKCRSMDLQIRRHIKIPEFTSRRFFVNKAQPDVKCYGKQIL